MIYFGMVGHQTDTAEPQMQRGWLRKVKFISQLISIAWPFFLTQSCSEVYSHASCSHVDLPNHQISKLTYFLDTNRFVYQLNCNEVTVVRHDITCDTFKLLNHIFSSAFSQKGYRQRGTVSEKRMHFAQKIKR